MTADDLIDGFGSVTADTAPVQVAAPVIAAAAVVPSEELPVKDIIPNASEDPSDNIL